MANLPLGQRLDLVAEGLPILLRSANSLYAAGVAVGRGERAAQILVGHAVEEASKILILLDYVRCPQGLSGRAHGQLRAFYDHGTRLIYAQACSWKPVNVDMLRSYVDQTRASHYIEGHAGEFILPNWELYGREARLYADVTRTDTGLFVWNDPDEWQNYEDFEIIPAALRVSRALHRAGAFSRAGLQIVHDIWTRAPFEHLENKEQSDELIETTLRALIASNLPAEDASDEDARAIYNNWQIPMYSIDIYIRQADLDVLRAEQEAQLAMLY